MKVRRFEHPLTEEYFSFPTKILLKRSNNRDIVRHLSTDSSYAIRHHVHCATENVDRNVTNKIHILLYTR